MGLRKPANGRTLSVAKSGVWGSVALDGEFPLHVPSMWWNPSRRLERANSFDVASWTTGFNTAARGSDALCGGVRRSFHAGPRRHRRSGHRSRRPGISL